MDKFSTFIASAVLGYMLRKVIISIRGGEFIMSLGRGGIRERRYQRIVWSLILLFYIFVFITELKMEESYLAYITSKGLINITLIVFLLDSQKFLQIDNDDIEKSRKIKYARNRFLYCSNYITKKPIS